MIVAQQDEAVAAGGQAAPAKKRGCGFYALVGAGVLVGLGVLGAIMDPAPSVPAASDAAGSGEQAGQAAPVEQANAPGITAAEFAALRTGMTHAEAAAIIGSAGELISESEIAGYHTVMYQWPGESGLGANANAMFQNDALVNKAQFGLE